MNSIFQTKEWEQFKLSTGYQKSYWLDDILILQKDVALSRTMLYSPMVSKAQVESIKLKVESEGFINQIRKIAKENNAIFYRLELDITASMGEGILRQVRDDKNNNIFEKSFEEMQPEYTLTLDLTKSEEDILVQMKQKGRYNIKIADKHKVKVNKSRKIDNFYTLYKQTAKRQKITFRGKQYFQKMIDLLEPKGYCEVFEASVEEKILATAIITFYKGQATYMFGSSSRELNKAMAPYKLHWEIIKEAKARNCREYDFFGVAPENMPNHPWAGVTSFKEKFGGERKEKIGSYDLILKPFEYKIFKIAEKVRR